MKFKIMVKITILVFLGFILTTSFRNTDVRPGFFRLFDDGESVEYKILEDNYKFDFKFLGFYLSGAFNNEPFIISPLGVQVICSLLLNGTRDTVYDEIIRFLEYSDVQGSWINEYYGNFIGGLSEKNPGAKEKLLLANSIWINKAIYTGTNKMNPEFLDIARKYYGVDLFEEYIGLGTGIKKINKWVSKNTEGKIEELFSAGEIPQDTLSLFINALYFEGYWIFEFDGKSTKEGEFHNEKGEVSLLDFMKGDDLFTVFYYIDENLQAVRLPYKGNKRSMVIILPNDYLKTEEVLGSMDSGYFLKIVKEAEVRNGLVRMPKFRIENSIDLIGFMKQNQMKEIFEPGNGFAPLFGNTYQFYINLFKQSAFIEVDEKGTKAAAATAGGSGCALTAVPQNNFYFNADHPFVYFIMDDSSGNILFMGYFNGKK